jgi:hypothetical protein
MAAGEAVERLLQQEDACMRRPADWKARATRTPVPVVSDGRRHRLDANVQLRLAALLQDNRTWALRGGASAQVAGPVRTRFSGTKPALAGAPRRWSVASFLADTRSWAHLQERS